MSWRDVKIARMMTLKTLITLPTTKIWRVMSQASVVIKTVVNEMMSMSTTTKHKPRAATYVQPAKDINKDLNKELSKESFLEKETF